MMKQIKIKSCIITGIILTIITVLFTYSYDESIWNTSNNYIAIIICIYANIFMFINFWFEDDKGDLRNRILKIVSITGIIGIVHFILLIILLFLLKIKTPLVILFFIYILIGILRLEILVIENMRFKKYTIYLAMFFIVFLGVLYAFFKQNIATSFIIVAFVSCLISMLVILIRKRKAKLTNENKISSHDNNKWNVNNIMVDLRVLVQKILI